MLTIFLPLAFLFVYEKYHGSLTKLSLLKSKSRKIYIVQQGDNESTLVLLILLSRDFNVSRGREIWET